VNWPEKQFIGSQNTQNSEFVEIIGFDNIHDELELLKKNIRTTNYSVGILLSENDNLVKKTYGERETQVWGVRQLTEYLKMQQNIEFGYKYRYESRDHDKLSMDQRVNVLTYHSAKGLEFDCVILPFINPMVALSEHEFFFTPFYVALTRAKKKLILTYNGFLHERFDRMIWEFEIGCDYCKTNRLMFLDNWDEIQSLFLKY
jgi:superfamily I DNA/RNA helicase